MAQQTPERPSGPTLPPRLVAVIATVLVGLFVFNVVADVVVKDYEGYPTTLLLGTIIGGLLGIHRYLRGGGGGS